MVLNYLYQVHLWKHFQVSHMNNSYKSYLYDLEINEAKGEPSAFRPRKLMQTLGKHRRLVNHEQQDAHEFFQILSSALSKEVAQMNKQRSITSLLDSTILQRLIQPGSVS
jgi:ubiquitin C-terminal hydrolase